MKNTSAAARRFGKLVAAHADQWPQDLRQLAERVNLYLKAMVLNANNQPALDWMKRRAASEIDAFERAYAQHMRERS